MIDFKLRVLIDDSDPERVATLVALGNQLAAIHRWADLPEGEKALAHALAATITLDGFETLWKYAVRQGGAFIGFEVVPAGEDLTLT